MTDDLLNAMLSLDDFQEEEIRDSNIVRAPFGYPGGKKQSAKYIIQKLPVRSVWVEVFGGSGVITLNRNSCSLDVFNDRYAGVVAFYRCIQSYEKTERLIERLQNTVHAREEFIYCKQNWEDHTVDDVERAARWYYMIQCSFANLGRNWARSTSGHATLKLREKLTLFTAFHYRFKHIQIENLDFTLCLKDYDSLGTVFYCDPPFLGSDTGIYKHKFKLSDHIKLLDIIHTLDGFVAVSSYKNELYDHYKWDQIITWNVSVTMKGMAFTKTNKQLNEALTRDRKHMIECLYIKEAKE